MAGRRQLGESSEPSNVIISAVLILVPLLTDGDSDQIGNRASTARWGKHAVDHVIADYLVGAWRVKLIPTQGPLAATCRRFLIS